MDDRPERDGPRPPHARMWVPYTVHGPDGGELRDVAVRSGDAYVTVDDLAEGVVVLEVSAWPTLDQVGRLSWTTAPVEIVTRRDTFQHRVDVARLDRGITAPHRVVRVGDAFLVRVAQPVEADKPRSGKWDRGRLVVDDALVVDISASARDAAKRALYGAVTDTDEAPGTDDERARGLGRHRADPSRGEFDILQPGTVPRVEWGHP